MSITITVVNHKLNQCYSNKITQIGFSMEKSENIGFFRKFVACDRKVYRYRQHDELMKCCEYYRSMSFLDLGQRSFTNFSIYTAAPSREDYVQN